MQKKYSEPPGQRLTPKKQNGLKEQYVPSNNQKFIPSVNFHLWEPCNMRCKFCFATFQDVKQSILPKGHLPEGHALDVVRQLAGFGFQKITFAGGEPTLCPWLPNLIQKAKALGMTTMIVTNGTRLTDEFLQENRQWLDWIAISIDSLADETNLKSGRALVGKTPITETWYRELVSSIKEAGYGLKINTVVHSRNLNEDFSEFIQWARPERWKVLQVLHIEGQNDNSIREFEISEKAFSAFKIRHSNLESVTSVVFEDVDAIRGSYAMVDPAGRFFDNLEGKHFYSDPILVAGCEQAFNQMRYDEEKFIERGGHYQWKRLKMPSRITLSGKVASGKSTVGKLLAEKLGYEFESLGNQVRKEAAKKGMTIGEFQQVCLQSPGMDQEIDNEFASECNGRERLVIDYRLGFAFVKAGFHIYLSVDKEVALDRIQKAGRSGDDERTLADRNETFRKQFEMAYNLEYTDPSHYDLVIDCSSEKSAEMVVEEILIALSK